MSGMKRLAAALLLAVATAAGAQPRATTPASTEELESRLPQLSGLTRANALTDLTDLLKNDRPAKAIEYGREALQLYASHADPVQEVRTLDEMAWAYMIVSDYGNAVASAEKGRDLARARGDQKGLARALNNLGVIAQRRGDGVTAVDLFTQSLAIYRQLSNPADIAAELNNLGFVRSSLLADYEPALESLLESLRIRETLGDDAAIALSLNNIGIIYDRTGDYDRALAYFNRALELRKNSGAQNRIAATLTNIGDVYLAKKEYDKAIAAQEEALTLRQKVGDREGAAFSLARLGRIYTETKRYDLAARNLNDALSIAEATGDKTTMGNCLIGLSDVSRGQRRAEAVQYATRALAVAEQTTGRELKRRALSALAESQEAAGDYAAALASYKKFKAENDRIFDEDKARRLEALERRYQFEKHEAEIQRLKGEEVLRASVADRQRLQFRVLVGSSVAAALIGFGLYRRRVEAGRVAEQLSITDALTGLKNRRFVLQTIQADLAAADRRRKATTDPAAPVDSDIVFMIIDIDRFKSVNDEYGHRAGDAVLTQVAHLLNGICRMADTIARWGGEEFLVISRFTDRRTASILADRIRSEFAANAFELGGGKTLHRTCSIGYASYPFSAAHPEVLTWEQIVAVADEALYMAKRGGANAWVGASASATATEEGLRRLQLRTADNLDHLIAEKVVVKETSLA